jgi:hypothetical protein
VDSLDESWHPELLHGVLEGGATSWHDLLDGVPKLHPAARGEEQLDVIAKIWFSWTTMSSLICSACCATAMCRMKYSRLTAGAGDALSASSLTPASFVQ